MAVVVVMMVRHQRIDVDVVVVDRRARKVPEFPLDSCRFVVTASPWARVMRKRKERRGAPCCSSAAVVVAAAAAAAAAAVGAMAGATADVAVEGFAAGVGAPGVFPLARLRP